MVSPMTNHLNPLTLVQHNLCSVTISPLSSKWRNLRSIGGKKKKKILIANNTEDQNYKYTG